MSAIYYVSTEFVPIGTQDIKVVRSQARSWIGAAKPPALADLHARRVDYSAYLKGAHLRTHHTHIEIARAASEGAGCEGRVAEWPLDEARQSLWGFADAIACDQVISGELAERELGWQPSRHSIVDELRSCAAAAARF